MATSSLGGRGVHARCTPQSSPASSRWPCASPQARACARSSREMPPRQDPPPPNFQCPKAVRIVVEARMDHLEDRTRRLLANGSRHRSPRAGGTRTSRANLRGVGPRCGPDRRLGAAGVHSRDNRGRRVRLCLQACSGMGGHISEPVRGRTTEARSPHWSVGPEAPPRTSAYLRRADTLSRTGPIVRPAPRTAPSIGSAVRAPEAYVGVSRRSALF